MDSRREERRLFRFRPHHAGESKECRSRSIGFPLIALKEHRAERRDRHGLLHGYVHQSTGRRERSERPIQIRFQLPGHGNVTVLQKRLDRREAFGRRGRLVKGGEVHAGERCRIFLIALLGRRAEVEVALDDLEIRCRLAGQLRGKGLGVVRISETRARADTVSKGGRRDSKQPPKVAFRSA